MHAPPALVAILVGSLTAACDSCKKDQTAAPPDAAGEDDAAATALAATGVSVLPVPSASVLAMVNPGGLPAYTGPTGSVEGDVLVKGDAAPAAMGKSFLGCPEAAATYAKTFRDGPPRDTGERPLADAVAAVRLYFPDAGPASEIFVPERKESQLVTIDQCALSARTIVLTYGQRLDVKNLTTPSSGKLYAPSFENQHDPALMVATPGGDAVKLYPKRMGRYRLVDKIKNDWLDADVFVIGHPLHAVSDVAGRYRIDGVPVGKRTINVYHPAIPGEGVTNEIDVRANVVSRLDVTLPYAKAPPPPPARDAGAQIVLP